MALKICRYCEESFILVPGKPGYADECPACLHEKTHPVPPVDILAKFLTGYPDRRRHFKNLRTSLLKLGIAESEVDGVIADFLNRSAKHK
jgi:hypothetical protein